MPMSHRPAAVDFTWDEGSTFLPPETVRAAALTVSLNARDVADARLLLDILGLAEGDHLATLRAVRPLRNPKRIGIGAR